MILKFSTIFLDSGAKVWWSAEMTFGLSVLRLPTFSLKLDGFQQKIDQEWGEESPVNQGRTANSEGNLQCLIRQGMGWFVPVHLPF